MQRRPVFLALMVLAAVLPMAACAGSGIKGAPSKDGEYTVRPGSVTYDGSAYRLMWQDEGGQLRELSGKGLKMVQDDARTYLSREKGETVLHLKPDEPVQVQGRDGSGDYSSPWFPFIVGGLIGNSLGRPSYHYPPSATFGRGDQLNGSVVTTKASPPKYEGLPANPNAVSGQNAGTGGGNAVTNKTGGPAVDGQAVGGAAAGAAVSGQAAGTGAGAAATAKGGFRSGSSSFEARSKAAPKPASGGTGTKPASRPKAPSGGGSRGGGRSGGK